MHNIEYIYLVMNKMEFTQHLIEPYWVKWLLPLSKL